MPYSCARDGSKKGAGRRQRKLDSEGKRLNTAHSTSEGVLAFAAVRASTERTGTVRKLWLARTHKRCIAFGWRTTQGEYLPFETAVSASPGQKTRRATTTGLTALFCLTDRGVPLGRGLRDGKACAAGRHTHTVLVCLPQQTYFHAFRTLPELVAAARADEPVHVSRPPSKRAPPPRAPYLVSLSSEHLAGPEVLGVCVRSIEGELAVTSNAVRSFREGQHRIGEGRCEEEAKRGREPQVRNWHASSTDPTSLTVAHKECTTGVSQTEEALPENTPPTYMGWIIVEARPKTPANAVHCFLAGVLTWEPKTNRLYSIARYWVRSLDGLSGKCWGEFLYDHLAIEDSGVLDSRMRDMEAILAAFANVDTAIGRLMAAILSVDASATSASASIAKRLAVHVTSSIAIAEQIVVLRRHSLLSLARARELGSLAHQ
ncbi:hypothetical protein SCHPADRAFT_947020 [Schizopora paradoxa]|uniref:Uncharacterized protein n=1 Tax=Schizopora paradoxa TaxID=27342 RepID=A0A0H2RKI1_9AGAM|nr:hypothetical protein SCHPADRAFT_947020 [Schizopora paradoxa]